MSDPIGDETAPTQPLPDRGGSAPPVTEPVARATRSQPRALDVTASERLLPADLHQRLLERYAAPSIVVDADHQVVHISENAARYLHVPAGEPSRDVLQLIRPELRVGLRTALSRAAREETNIAVRSVPVSTIGGDERVRLLVKPVLREGDQARGFFLVLFEPEHDASAAEELESKEESQSLAEEHVTALLRKLVTAQEDERARIARDLHDQLGQQLTALRLTLERHRERCPPGEGSGDDLQRAIELTAAIDQQVDFLAWELRPAALEDLGLAAALPQFLAGWGRHYGIAAEFRCAGYAAGHLSREGEVTLYRIAQEALNNVVKHAHASRVDVMLETRGGSVTLLVEDDGIGFDPLDRTVMEDGIGLLGMRERAALIGATLEIESVPGHGTTVFVRHRRQP